MEFKEMLRDRIVEVLDSWPAEDQYAVMFFIYPNQSHEYRGYADLPEFSMLYRCESELGKSGFLFFRPSRDEDRWNPACWDWDREDMIIGFGAPNAFADALIDWYEALGVRDIGVEDTEHAYDSRGIYVGNGPNGMPELLALAAEIAAELRNDGIIRDKFGRDIPIILADLEFTWYMVKATRDANPNGEADEYIEACIRSGWVLKDQIE